jgi:hypothetical protein
MLVQDDTKSFVNPLLLGRRSLSAGYRRRSLGLVIPEVVRPMLLSDQLGGCGCASCAVGLAGMGQMDYSGAISDLSSAITQAKQMYDQLLAALGIGAGAREADMITPLQNQITNTVLVPAVNMGENPQATCADLVSMQRNIQTAHDQFQFWLTNTHWADGRAAQQALSWLNGPLPASASQAAPSWFHQVQSDFTNTVVQKCGSAYGGSIITLPGGFTIGSNVLLIGAGLAAFFLLRRPRG